MALRATMRVDGEVFRSGTAKVPLIKDATLLDAGVDGRALPIVTEGTHIALVSRSGGILGDTGGRIVRRLHAQARVVRAAGAACRQRDRVDRHAQASRPTCASVAD